MANHVVGIDVGYGPQGITSGVSFFELVEGAAEVQLEVFEPTEALTTAALHDFTRKDARLQQAALVAMDAPLTPARLAARPGKGQGRSVDAHFSRGAFSNGKRGPQPGSICTPNPGWSLYVAGMQLREILASHGFVYLAMPEERECQVVGRPLVEVIPKLTQALIAGPELTRLRPGSGANKKIDDFLFPRLFAPQTETTYPFGRALTLPLRDGRRARLGPKALADAQRINGLPTQHRHEGIGAFVSGLQGALVLAAGAQLVGAPGPYEGYFALPSCWHQEWEAEWEVVALRGDLVRRVPMVIPQVRGVPAADLPHR